MRLTDAAWADIAAAITPQSLRRRPRGRHPDPARELVERYMRDAVAIELRAQAAWMRTQASSLANYGIEAGIRLAADALDDGAGYYENFEEKPDPEAPQTRTKVG